MKRIIDGKRYDTETADHIAQASASCPVNDFNHWEENLYRTKSGRFFLVGEGGPMTGYARSCGQNQWTGGSDLQPLTDDEARSWLERHKHTEALEEFFADLIEEA